MRVRSKPCLVELRFKRGYPCGKLLVLVARPRRHLLDRLELLPGDDVHARHHPLHLRAGEGLRLALRAVGKARGVGHETREVVEKAAVGLRHGSTPGDARAWAKPLETYVARAHSRRKSGLDGREFSSCPTRRSRPASAFPISRPDPHAHSSRRSS